MRGAEKDGTTLRSIRIYIFLVHFLFWSCILVLHLEAFWDTLAAACGRVGLGSWLHLRVGTMHVHVRSGYLEKASRQGILEHSSML